MSIIVRNATLDDAKRILEIYSYYVENTAITFEYATPSLLSFQERMENTMKKFPYLVIEKDGVVEGYAYAGVFFTRPAYNWCCELTVYLNHETKRCGLGKKLYEAIERVLRSMGILNLYARIAYPLVEDEYLTRNSAEFHNHLGFTKVAEFNKCGFKFNRWYNMICVEKIIGVHQEQQATVEFHKHEFQENLIKQGDYHE